MAIKWTKEEELCFAVAVIRSEMENPGMKAIFRIRAAMQLIAPERRKLTVTSLQQLPWFEKVRPEATKTVKFLGVRPAPVSEEFLASVKPRAQKMREEITGVVKKPREVPVKMEVSLEDQVASLNKLTESLVGMVNTLRGEIQVMKREAMEYYARPMEHEMTVSVRTSSKKQKVTIIGMHPDNKQEILREFGSKFDLVVIDKEKEKVLYHKPGKISGKVFVMHGTGHALDGVVKKKVENSSDYKFIPKGGLTTLRRELESLH